MLLKDENIFPSDEVLSDTLGITFRVFQEFIKKIESDEFKLEKQWIYYHDGKAWFCKIQFKKKTILWLTVWDKYFKIILYFAEKSDQDIKALEISEEIKNQFKEIKRIGKIKPIVIDIKNCDSLHDVYKLITYKKSIH